MSASSENSPELLDQVLHELGKLGQRWHNRPTRKGFRFTQSYLDLKLRVHFSYRLQGSTEERVVSFERKPRFGNEVDTHLGPVSGEAPVYGQRRSEIESHKLKGRKCLNDKAMFIHDVEVVQDSDCFVIPSEVRFYRKAEFDEVTRRTLYFSQHSGFILRGSRDQLLVVTPDRERCLGGVTRDHRIGEIIEGCTQRMDDIPRPEGDLSDDLSGEICRKVVFATLS
jgi:hypothetical protein